MSEAADGMDAVGARVADYYSAKLARHGATPRGVDWSCRPTQELRFAQLLRLCDFGRPFSLDDLGCGYGALPIYLRQFHPAAVIDYLGIDLSPAMIRAARRRHPRDPKHSFVVGSASPRLADYAVASGIMNVKLENSDAVWEAFVATTLRGLRQGTRRGFAVNFMAEAPAGMIHPWLYRPPPTHWPSFCADELGCSVKMLTGYGLREFTLLAQHDGDSRFYPSLSGVTRQE